MKDTKSRLAETLELYTKRLESSYCTDALVKRDREKLDELIKHERVTWANRVRALNRKRRKGWGHVSARCFFLIDHSTRPCSGSIIVELHSCFCDGKRRGELKLSGLLEESEQVLEEARRILA